MSLLEWEKNREFLASGLINLYLPIEPVSLQASRRKKEVVTSQIHRITSAYNFILVGDVQIDIEWHIHEQNRYESDSSADVDNIIKPILDALCGPKGILVNDCQVQAISCRWIDWESDNQEIIIRIQMFFNDEWLLKSGLIFTHMGKGICYPILLNDIDPKYTLVILENLESKIARRDELMSKGMSYYHAQGVMSIQRVFHISRVQDFDIIQLNDLKKQLLSESEILKDF